MWNGSELLALSQLCAQVNAFSSDDEDEFSILRKDGSRQGIFKTWGVPVIPFLDGGNIHVLAALWPTIIEARRKNRDSNFWEILSDLACFGDKSEIQQLAQTAISTLNLWRGRMVEHPARLEQSLERARLYSWLLDRWLTEAFLAEPLPDDLSLRISQLTNRLLVAFGLTNPFYNLEAIAADPQLLSSEKGQDASAYGNGKLDVVAFLLPVAFREWVVADTLNWNGLNWELIHHLTDEMLADPLLEKILLNLSRETGLPPEHILFAANVLEWVPTAVGGKKCSPVKTQEAQRQLAEIVSQREPQEKSVISVLARVNSLIRFLNWFPLIEGEENFRGQNWSYAAVCDTTSLLLETLSDHPEAWKEGFAELFTERLRPQLMNLDASSARGRFLLHLILEERRLEGRFFQGVDNDWQRKLLAHIAEQSKAEAGRLEEPTHRIYPLSLVGGKPLGLALASYAAGWETVLDGFVLSTSEVGDFLCQDPQLWEQIIRLDQEIDPGARLALAQRVEVAIGQQPIPDWFAMAIDRGLGRFSVDSWAVRSSALNEGEARGVYETMLGVERERCAAAARECISSYFSRKAVLFRITSGHGDLPCFAVLFQPYVGEEGGVCEIRLDERDTDKIYLTIGENAAEGTASAPDLEEWEGTLGVDHPPVNATEIIELAEELRTVFGPLQLEWTRSNKGVTILQMESLPTIPAPVAENEEPPENAVQIESLADTDKVASLIARTQGTVQLDLGHEIRLDAFQGELMALIVRFGGRITEVSATQHISPTSHFANICRYFGITISS